MAVNNKKEIAFLFFMQNMQQQEICERAGVSAPTLKRWKDKDNWEARRAAANITRGELVNKVLMAIGKLLDENTDKVDPNLADKLAKFSSTIESLDKKNNVVNDIETFMNFNRYLQAMLQHDKSLNVDFIKRVNAYQDAFITERMTKR